MKRIFALLSLLVLGSCTSLPTNPREPASVTRPPFELSDQCRGFIRSLDSGFKYGWVPSYLSPNSDDKIIYVFYYHRPSPGKTPILVFNGGPVVNSHYIYNRLKYDENTEIEKPWYIFMDQRGTGCSSGYPDKIADAKQYMYWGTEGIVRDAEVVRTLLGVSRWNIFGQSYGSFIVHRYLQMHPESVSIAVGHGGAPLAEYSAYNRLRYEQQLHVIKKYLQEYPGDAEIVKNIVRKGRCLEGGELCGGYAVRALSASLMGFRENWFELHDRLRLLNISKYPRAYEKDSEDESDRVVDIMKWLNAEIHGSNSVVNCNKVRRQALSILGPPELFAFSECWGRNGDEGRNGLSEHEYAKAMAELKIPQLSTKAIRENLEKHSDIKFYLFSSELDYYTPPAIISRAAGEMGPRVKYERMRFAGHEAYIYAPVLRVLLPGLDLYLKEQGY